MMKNRIVRTVVATALFSVILGIGSVSANENGAAEKLSNPERFSLGIIIGQPTGVSAKLWLGEVSAVDAAAAWNFERSTFHFHGDYLQHFFNVFDVAPDRLPVYVGVGGNFRLDGEDPGDTGQFRSGVRVPVGVSFLSDELPLDAFVEAVPGLRVIPDTAFEFWAGIGARYRF